jgi:hypothetical protein
VGLFSAHEFMNGKMLAADWDGHVLSAEEDEDNVDGSMKYATFQNRIGQLFNSEVCLREL